MISLVVFKFIEEALINPLVYGGLNIGNGGWNFEYLINHNMMKIYKGVSKIH